MTLIRTMMERPLDPGYRAAADRREAQGLPRSTSLRSPRLLAATLAIGLVVGGAAANLRATSSPRSAARADLVKQIESRRVEVDRLSVEAQRLQAQVATLEAAQLGPSAGGGERGRQLAMAAGAVAMTGPGMLVTLDDAPDADTATGDQADQQRVLSRDLQYVVNFLWQAGAEAVSINGNRITSVSAIRFAGSAIIVDFRPLTRPYRITALGDPRTLPGAFADGAGGAYLTTLHNMVGVRADTEVHDDDDLSVPGAVGLTTRYAQTVDTGASPTSGAPTDPEDGSS
ncbi:MAG: DUF881 domain-containing protein [Micrococcales bacterium]|uniref:DUF881 domain-containing protein n=1 Tax=Phycicoccus sp. TaxID=1902410 RepID=UPI00198E17EF|nr:DUF881 domain-containing protein [Phycicoccus sp.]MBD3783575.1 DUF881 domain-containing protein [Micrococcales bacterium]HMM94778.1 DUF881 domain-containing protein [Phycicoccus sp.]